MATHPSSRAIIDFGAYSHNLDAIRSLLKPGVRMMGVVKADAYGHGLVPMAKHAVSWGVQCLGVATVDEAITLRQAQITAPIIVLFEPVADALEAIVEHDLCLVLAERSTGECLAALAEKRGKRATVHCQVDTGMGRQGFTPATAVNDIRALAALKSLHLEGICTHFPVADGPNNAYTLEQIRQFDEIAKALRDAGVTFEQKHSCNSAGVVNYPEAHFNLVRAGLMSYGVWPSETPQPPDFLRPVLEWSTRIVQVREFTPGSSISYGRTFTTPETMRAAILSVGYADGYRHRFSNRAEVLIRGVRCPVRGNVCMDQTVVDVTRVPDVKTGDRAILIGTDGDQRITAEELAPLAETIPYEILTCIGNRVARIARRSSCLAMDDSRG